MSLGEAALRRRVDSLVSSDGDDFEDGVYNEVEKKKTEYIEECKRCQCTPVSQFFESIDKSTVLLRHHGLRTKGFHAMSKLLLENGNLQELDLAENCIDDKGGAALCDLISQHTRLVSLDFSQNQIGGLGFCRNISEALGSNTSLKQVKKSVTFLN
jgi:Ran GTPase-activating protein (RanGAP) involved in mRNA processing and transport